MNLDVLAPYAGAIKAIAYALCIALLLGLGGYAGCSHQSRKDQDKIAAAQAETATWKKQSEVNAEAINEANRQVKANQQFAREQLALAEAANKAADEQKKKNQEQAADFRKKLADAKKLPDCKTVLEMNLCSALQDY